ncbi:MAG: LuxR C-terminal-related transcriptional regulator [Bifidobacteriaceae bacterium]|jgi:DNA-binding CsgD family transcriptional regulator|nr:LuxR C-terminal-related transcriptional regulator [Bifidobacteriaceae bacterium]
MASTRHSSGTGQRDASEPGKDIRRGESVVLAAVSRFMPLRRLGWSFLLAWVFCVFYTGIVDGYAGATWSWENPAGWAETLFFSGLPVFMAVVTLVAIVFIERRFGPPTDHRTLFWLAPAATAISTPLLFWAAENLGISTAMFMAGAALTGFGSGFMWVMWGEFYARISQEDAEFLAPASAVASALLVLLVSAMDGWIALAFVTTLPLLSGLCFFLSWRDIPEEPAAAGSDGRIGDTCGSPKRSPLRVLSEMGRVGFGILIACLFVCLAGTFWNAPDRRGLVFHLVLVVATVFMGAVSFAATFGPRRVSIAFLYRWMCPALVIGFVALILFDLDVGGYIAYLVAMSARFAFCVITQMYFARYAATGKATAVQAYGLGWIFVHLGDFLGVVVSVSLAAPLAARSVLVTQVSAVSIAVLVVATMFVLNASQSFSADQGRTDRLATGLAAEGYAAPALELRDDLAGAVRQLAATYELTPRETEVFDLLARGRSVPYVRDALVISKDTAATHTKHIYQKLGVHSRQELIDLVLSWPRNPVNKPDS